MCKTKWIQLTKEETKEYDYPTLSRCNNCRKYNNTFFVHDPWGDYLCTKCEKPGDVVIYCVSCARKK